MEDHGDGEESCGPAAANRNGQRRKGLVLNRRADAESEPNHEGKLVQTRYEFALSAGYHAPLLLCVDIL